MKLTTGLCTLAICLSSLWSLGQVPFSNLQTLEYSWINPAMNSGGAVSMAVGSDEMKRWRGTSSAQFPLGAGRTTVGYVMSGNPGYRIATSCGPTITHGFRVADSVVVRLGFKPYYYSEAIDFTRVAFFDPIDPILDGVYGQKEGRLMCDLGVGVSYQSFYGGLNIVNVANSGLDLGSTTIRPNDNRGYVVIVGAKPRIGSWSLDASVAQISTRSLETTTFSCIGTFKKGVLCGIGYRTDDKAMVIFSGFRVPGLGRWLIGASKNDRGSYAVDSAIVVDLP